jgi:hypothetical protein
MIIMIVVTTVAEIAGVVAVAVIAEAAAAAETAGLRVVQEEAAEGDRTAGTDGEKKRIFEFSN